jgi:hypothetical protein
MASAVMMEGQDITTLLAALNLVVVEPEGSLHSYMLFWKAVYSNKFGAPGWNRTNIASLREKHPTVERQGRDGCGL